MAVKKASKRVADALAAAGLEPDIATFPASTRTATDAAEAIGCTVEQIAKSLIFKTKSTDRPVLIVASGGNRADLDKIATLIGEGLGKADAAFVREKTGYAIGGVPPVGHAVTPITLLDMDLRKFDTIWAAAGTPNTVFKLTPTELARITGAEFCDIASI